jgi:NAD+ kinase
VAADERRPSDPKEREVLLVAHTGRPAARRSAAIVLDHFATAGVAVRILESESAALNCRGARVVPDDERAAEGVEVVLVLGGDGTLLRAAEIARPAQAPLLGVNLGRVGFLAEAERADLTSTVERVTHRSYEVEERMTLDVLVRADGTPRAATWALNDCSVEKAARARMLDVIVEVDGRPLSRLGCDGVIAATPTGSTAYAFSAGGPVIWPEVEALLVVPISAHALFARPLVVAPGSTVALELAGGASSGDGLGVLWCDGRRSVDLQAGMRVEVRRGSCPVRLARLQRGSFTDRLVSKFGLPVHGWRGYAERA